MSRHSVITAIATAVAVALYWITTSSRPPLALYYLLQVCLLVSSIYLLGAGAGYLVDASSRLARRLNISELLIGLTVVAFGTSAPEVAASLVAGFNGSGDIAVGNVIGSNIFNLCFILGGVALAVRGGLSIDRALIFRDGPAVVIGIVLVYACVGGALLQPISWRGPVAPLNLTLEWGEGLLLLAGLVLYLVLIYRSRSQSRRALRADREASLSIVADITLVIVGLGLVLGGSHLLVGDAAVTDAGVDGFGAVWFAKQWHVPDYVIGLTIIAAGTSAPEMVVSLVAALRGSPDISTGNLLGSVVFNLFGVVGVVGLFVQPPLGPTVTVSPDVLPNLIGLSLLTVLIIIFMMTGRRIARWEGALLVLIGCAFWIADFVFR